MIRSSLIKMKNILINDKYDLVHLNTSCLLIPAIAAKSLGLKVIWHIREELHSGVFGIRRHIIRKIFHKYSDIIISISRTNAEKHI